jgi:2-polyprenyl-3-methyl-5-hydroxy-6-metoxy-1,4-benzoquinol methylase
MTSKERGSVKLKKNVEVFNDDILSNRGYKYTTNNSYSASVANKRLTDVTLEIISRYKNLSSLIDIGCGDGIYTNEIKKKCSNVNVSAFDPASKAIDLARKSYPKIDFFIANLLEESSLPTKKFDIAIIRGVLHHLDYPELAIRNASKIAKKIIIIDPNGNNPLLKLIEKKSKYHIEHEEKSYSFREFVTFCENSQCKIDKIYYVGFVPFFFPTIPAKIIYFFQPLLEKIPILNYYFAAQIIILINNKELNRA